MIEIELKLSINPTEFYKLKSHISNYQIDEFIQYNLVNTYFDTEDLIFSKNLFAMRIRELDGEFIQTLKTAGRSESGFSKREEFDFIIESNKIQTHLFYNHLPSLLHSYLNNIVGLFSCNFKREKTNLIFNKSEIELVFDFGIIKTFNNQSQIISEVELELKNGNEIDLVKFALFICEKVQVMPLNSSKAKRGFDLLEFQNNEESILELLEDAQNYYEKLSNINAKLFQRTLNEDFKEFNSISKAYISTLLKEKFNV